MVYEGAVAGSNLSPGSIAVVSFSLSHQTGKVVRELVRGVEEAAGPHAVALLRLRPVEPIPFPFPSVGFTLWMMVKTLFRARVAIEEPEMAPLRRAKLLILAGPTWSYNPCGPVLSFLDRYGPEAMAGKPVLGVISCRGYWRLHWRYLRSRIEAAGGTPLGPWVFPHPVKEPWRTLGVLLTVSGRHPRRHRLLRDRYPRYGHDQAQLQEAARLGRELARLWNHPHRLHGPKVIVSSP